MKRTVDKEQFYTSPSLVKACMSLVHEHVDMKAYDLFLEPAAGAGAFLHQLPEGRRMGLDIDPKSEGITEQDFLSWHPRTGQSKIMAVGNPPYGQRAAMAFKFIEHACAFSEVIAFILPRSFNKWTFQNRIPRFFHLVASMDCQEFQDASGRPVLVKSVFQIWVRRERARINVDLPSVHPDFEMRHAHLSRTSPDEVEQLQRYDFAVAQVGNDFKPRPVHTIKKGSYWFIKLRSPELGQYFQRLDFSFIGGMNTAHSSLSKRDIIFAYTQVAPSAPRASPSKVEPQQMDLFCNGGSTVQAR